MNSSGGFVLNTVTDFRVLYSEEIVRVCVEPEGSQAGITSWNELVRSSKLSVCLLSSSNSN
jgi:hypothetical protein